MNIKDLSIGDWVLLKSKPGKVVGINRISPNWETEGIYGVDVLLPVDDTIVLVSNAEIEKIFIFPEIMEKNGFRNVEGSSRWLWYLDGGDDYRVVATGLGTSSFLQYQRYLGDGDWSNIAQMTCVGVNGIQRFFQMTGINKEIVLYEISPK